MIVGMDDQVSPEGGSERRNLWNRKAAQLAPILTLLVLAARLFLKPSVPTRFLIHTHDDPSQTSAATILQFKADGQYVERMGYLADSGKGNLSFSPGDNNVVAVGTWDQRGATLTVHRERVARAIPYDGPYLDPLCQLSIVKYDLAGDGVRDGSTVFRPSSRLRLDDWESYVSRAKSTGVSCRRAG